MTDCEWNKQYNDWSGCGSGREGELIPTAFVWEDGRKYAIDKVSKPERCASRKAGGTGYRYTCQVGGKICHLTYEENYKWFMERK